MLKAMSKKFKSRNLEHFLLFFLIWWFPFDIMLIPEEKYSVINRLSLVFLWGPHFIYILYICKSLECDGSKFIVTDILGLRKRYYSRVDSILEYKYKSSISQCLLLTSENTIIVFYPQGIRKFHEIKNSLVTKEL